jgi:hypothetical protein
MEQPELEKFKTDLHRTLISKLDLEKLSRVNSVQARQAVAEMINEIVVSQRVPLSFEQQEKVQDESSWTTASSEPWMMSLKYSRSSKQLSTWPGLWVSVSSPKASSMSAPSRPS